MFHKKLLVITYKELIERRAQIKAFFINCNKGFLDLARKNVKEVECEGQSNIDFDIDIVLYYNIV